MELIISILIYLGALIPNNNYTMDEVDAKAAANQQQIDVIAADEDQAEAILLEYSDDFIIDESKELVQLWDDEEFEYD